MEKVIEMIPVEETKEKKKNKGFSLVELIIVIAIMAILVGVVGTQVMPYIEKSREAKDVQILSSLCTAGLTAFSQNAASLDSSKIYGISNFVKEDTATTEHLTANTDAPDAVVSDFTALSAYTDRASVTNAMESKVGKTIATINVVYKASTGELEVTAYTSTSTIVFKTIKAK